MNYTANVKSTYNNRYEVPSAFHSLLQVPAEKLNNKDSHSHGVSTTVGRGDDIIKVSEVVDPYMFWSTTLLMRNTLNCSLAFHLSSDSPDAGLGLSVQWSEGGYTGSNSQARTVSNRREATKDSI